MKSLILGALALAGMASAAAAQDHRPAVRAMAVGEWELTYETPRGHVTTKITITREGEGFAGTAEMPRGGPAPLSQVRVEGNHVAFSITRGRGDRTFTLLFRGTIDGDAASGTVTGMRGNREIAWTARRLST